MERAGGCLGAIWRFYERLMIILSIIFMLVVWTVGSIKLARFSG